MCVYLKKKLIKKKKKKKEHFLFSSFFFVWIFNDICPLLEGDRIIP